MPDYLGEINWKSVPFVILLTDGHKYCSYIKYNILKFIFGHLNVTYVGKYVIWSLGDTF